MKEWQDYYYILQVHHDAEQEVIESAYKRLCKKYHPDTSGRDIGDGKIKELNLAYEVLKKIETRKEYHKEWLKHNNIDKEKDLWNFKKGSDTEDAKRVVDRYVKALSDKNYKLAYEMLSNFNKKYIGLEQYTEWQNAVAKSYEIGSFKSKLFKVLSDFPFSKTFCTKAIDYQIDAYEKNMHTGKISDYKFSKIAIYEGQAWKIYLEYEDVELLTYKFKYLHYQNNRTSLSEEYADLSIKKDLVTGLLSKKGFLDELEKEKNRFLRYKNNFSVAIISIDLPSECEYDFNEEMVRYIAFIIRQCVRNTDVISNINNNIFGIGFIETQYENAKTGLDNLENALRGAFKQRYKDDLIINKHLVEHAGRDVIVTYNSVYNKVISKSKFDNQRFENRS